MFRLNMPQAHLSEDPPFAETGRQRRPRPTLRLPARARSLAVMSSITLGLLAAGAHFGVTDSVRAKPTHPVSTDSLAVTQQPIKLNFVVLDEAGLPVPGAKVKVWQDLEDPDRFVHKQTDKALALGKPTPSYANVAAPKDPLEAPGAFHMQPDLRQNLGLVTSDATGHAVLTLNSDGIQANVADRAWAGWDPSVAPIPPLVETTLVSTRYLNYLVEPGTNTVALGQGATNPSTPMKVMASGTVQAFALNPHYTGTAPSAEVMLGVQQLIADHSLQVITATLKSRTLLSTEDLAQALSALGDEAAASTLRNTYGVTSVNHVNGAYTQARPSLPARDAIMPSQLPTPSADYVTCVHRLTGDGPMIKGIVWADLIQPPDKTRQPEEPALPDTLVLLRNSSGTIVRGCKTNGTGRYAWSVGNLPVGNYRVHFIAPDQEWQSSGAIGDIATPMGNEALSKWFPRPFYQQVQTINAGFTKTPFDGNGERIVGSLDQLPIHVARIHLLPGMTATASALSQRLIRIGFSVGVSVGGNNPLSTFLGFLLSQIPKTGYTFYNDDHLSDHFAAASRETESPLTSSITDVWYDVGMELSCYSLWDPGNVEVGWHCSPRPDGMKELVTSQVSQGDQLSSEVPTVGPEVDDLAEVAGQARPNWPTVYDSSHTWGLAADQVVEDEFELGAVTLPIPLCPPCQGIWLTLSRWGSWGVSFTYLEKHTFEVERTITEQVWSYATQVVEYGEPGKKVPGIVQFRDCTNMAWSPTQGVACSEYEDVPFLAYVGKAPKLAQCELWYHADQAFGPHVDSPTGPYQGPYDSLLMVDDIEITKDGGSGTCHTPPCTRAKYTSRSNITQNAELKLGQYDWSAIDGIQIGDIFEFEGSDLQIYKGGSHRMELTVIQGLTGVQPIQDNSGSHPARFGGLWESPDPHRYQYESAKVLHGATPGHRYAELRSVNMNVWVETPNAFNLISGKHVVKGRNWHGNDLATEHVLERTTEFQNSAASYWDENRPGYTGRPNRGFKHCFGLEQ